MSDIGEGDAANAPAVSAASALRRASALLAAGTMVSRVLGFFSAAILAWVLGQQNASVNAFRVANGLPNSVYTIIAAGLLSAVLVPQIVRASRDPDGGQRFINKLLTLGVCVFLAIALVVTVFAGPVTTLFTLGQTSALSGDGFGLATAFALWCLPQVFFYALYSLLGEAYNARGIFGPFTWAPAINNVVVIAGLLVFAAIYGVDPAHQDPTSWDPAQIALLGGGATLGIAAQSLVLVVFWRRTGFAYRPDFRWRGVGLGSALKAAGWSFAGVLIIQVGGIVQSAVSLSVGPNDPSTAVLSTAWLIFMLPHSIVAISIATPYFTRLSGHAAAHDLPAMRSDLAASLKVIGMLIAGAAAALGAAALPFAAIFANTPGELAGIASVLLAFLLGLLPYSCLFVLQRGFYAQGDTRTPFFYQILQIGLFVIGALVVGATVPSPMVAVGIAVSSSIATAAQTLVSAVLLRRRLGGRGGGELVRHFALYLLATVPAAAVGIGVLALLGGFSGGFAVSGRVPGFLSVIIVGGIAFLVYLVALAQARLPEVREIGLTVRRMLRR